MPEQLWEMYKATKERVVEAIATSMGSKDDASVRAEAKKIEITCDSRVGTYRLGKPRPMSVTFQRTNYDLKENPATWYLHK